MWLLVRIVFMSWFLQWRVGTQIQRLAGCLRPPPRDKVIFSACFFELHEFAYVFEPYDFVYDSHRLFELYVLEAGHG